MPYCGNCGALVNDSANFCMKCGAPRKKNTPQVATNPVPTENEIARENSANSRTSDNVIDNTNCSTLPLDWTKWPNLILIENADSQEMTDSIATFIQRTNSIENSFFMYYLVNLDRAKSWSSLKNASVLTFYDDNVEMGAANFYGIYGTCSLELDSLTEKHLSNIDEYNKASTDEDDRFPHQFIFIDDYDTLIQSANDEKLQNDLLPYLVSNADRLGVHLFFGSKSGPQILGNLKNAFTVISPSEFARICNGECSTENEIAREKGAKNRTFNSFIDNTKCSSEPLNWKSWPNLILIENAFPPEMADNIAAFIKRTRGNVINECNYTMDLVNLDPTRSWSSLDNTNANISYYDDVEMGEVRFFGIYESCLLYQRRIAEKRLSNIEEYTKAFPREYFPHLFLIIDDYDTFIRRANEDRIQDEWLPYIVSYANRLGAHLIFCSRSGPQILGNLKNSFTVISQSEFTQMCKGEYSTNTIVNSTVTGYDFEQYCADLLSKNSFINVKVTKKSGDQGIDILAEKDYVKYAIQCKYYTSPVGNNAVQEAFTGKSYYGCHIAVVMTNNTFTDSARQLASQLGVVLWDGNFISELQKANN